MSSCHALAVLLEITSVKMAARCAIDASRLCRARLSWTGAPSLFASRAIRLSYYLHTRTMVSVEMSPCLELFRTIVFPVTADGKIDAHSDPPRRCRIPALKVGEKGDDRFSSLRTGEKSIPKAFPTHQYDGATHHKRAHLCHCHELQLPYVDRAPVPAATFEIVRCHCYPSFLGDTHPCVLRSPWRWVWPIMNTSCVSPRISSNTNRRLTESSGIMCTPDSSLTEISSVPWPKLKT